MQIDDFSFELNSNAKVSNGRVWVGGQVYGSGGQEGTLSWSYKFGGCQGWETMEVTEII